MIVNDVVCDGICGLAKGAASNWFQITVANGNWRMSPLLENPAPANGGAEPKHCCPKPECAKALLTAWMEKQVENTIGKVRLILEEEVTEV